MLISKIVVVVVGWRGQRRFGFFFFFVVAAVVVIVLVFVGIEIAKLKAVVVAYRCHAVVNGAGTATDRIRGISVAIVVVLGWHDILVDIVVVVVVKVVDIVRRALIPDRRLGDVVVIVVAAGSIVRAVVFRTSGFRGVRVYGKGHFLEGAFHVDHAESSTGWIVLVFVGSSSITSTSSSRSRGWLLLLLLLRHLCWRWNRFGIGCCREGGRRIPGSRSAIGSRGRFLEQKGSTGTTTIATAVL
mmetsp:Transcript_26015/g.54470  ORF Transcript_26015/g.54470 Transcript_26015/m.54470 type:complete len:243 (-) Transcript_26015:264-992(-)